MSKAALQVLGTGEYVPSRRIPSTDFDRHWDKPAGWTLAHTGVESRAHAGPGETCISMGAAAARDALRRAGVEPQDLDAVISVSSVGHQAIPCTAVLLHRELGIAGSGVPAFDVNSTCTGFLTALDLLAPAIAAGRFDRVLVVASEVPSTGLNPEDKSTAALFGDGAGAVVIGRAQDANAALDCVHIRTFSEGADLCELRAGGTGLTPRTRDEEYLPGTYFEMSGRSLYRIAATLLPPFLAELMHRGNTRIDDVDAWVPHQASGHAIDHLRAALGLPLERMVSTLRTHGNQVAASIPIALHRGIESGLIRSGKRVALLGTGAGITLAGAVLRF